MHVLRLQLSQFRNLAQAQLTVPAGVRVVALVGTNGSGKTSVLEALSLLSPTRGILAADAAQQLHQPSAGPIAKEWTLFAEVADPNGLTTHVGQSARKGNRTVQLDGQRQTLEQLGRVGPVVWLSPQTDFLFSGPPASRRRWLDDHVTVLIPAHAGAVARFQQHRQARLKLLMNHAPNQWPLNWLAAEELQAAQAGIQVLRQRQQYLTALAPFLQPHTLALSGAASSILLEADPIAALQGKFERSRDIDARLGRTHAGPNTLELVAHLQLETTTVNLTRASSGQHKRWLLHWLAAHARLLASTHQQPPLVLIDEFSAHLDLPRRQQLLHELLQLGSQVWLTDTENPALQLVNQQFLRIAFPLPTPASATVQAA